MIWYFYEYFDKYLIFQIYFLKSVYKPIEFWFECPHNKSILIINKEIIVHSNHIKFHDNLILFARWLCPFSRKIRILTITWFLIHIVTTEWATFCKGRITKRWAGHNTFFHVRTTISLRALVRMEAVTAIFNWFSWCAIGWDS